MKNLWNNMNTPTPMDELQKKCDKVNDESRANGFEWYIREDGEVSCRPWIDNTCKCGANDWKYYQGFTAAYEYCGKCGVRRIS